MIHNTWHYIPDALDEQYLGKGWVVSNGDKVLTSQLHVVHSLESTVT